LIDTAGNQIIDQAWADNEIVLDNERRSNGLNSDEKLHTGAIVEQRVGAWRAGRT
jgi:hypothetical protein